MNIDKLNNWLSLAANLGVLLGIVFLALEIQQSNRVAESELTRSRTGDIQAVRAQENEFADLWTKGLSGGDLSLAEQEIFDNILLSHWGQIYASTQARAALREISGVALVDFAGFLYRNPVARTRWEFLMDQEQSIRQALLPNPAGVEYMNIVISNLEKLSENGQ